MEAIGRALCRHHRDVARQDCVQRIRHALRWRPSVRMEARDLPGRVHARVGATRHDEPCPAGEHLVERLAERPLDRPLGGLARPAAEARAVVLERELEQWHRPSLR